MATHTVVLYKNDRGDILVIDPNNPKFSGHLQHVYKNVLVSNSPSEMHKIYAPKHNAKKGPDKDSYRDCIDLAAKLAALLDLDPGNYLSVDEVMKSNAVLLVSNNPNITKLPKRMVEDLPFRIKQVSHLVKLQEINEELSKHALLLQKRVESADVEFEAKLAELKREYNAKIDNANVALDSDVSTLVGLIAIDQELEDDYA